MQPPLAKTLFCSKKLRQLLHFYIFHFLHPFRTSAFLEPRDPSPTRAAGSPSPAVTMLEYFTYKKVKKHRAAKEAKKNDEAASASASQPTTPKTDERPKRPDTASTRGSAASGPAPPPGQPVLDRSDESFLESILSDDGQAPPLPDRVDLSDLELSASEVASLDARKEKDKKKEKSKGKDKEKANKDGKPSRFASVFRKKDKDRQHGDTLKPEDAISPEEEEQKEKTDLNRVLDRLNLTAKNNKVVNLSGDSAELLAKFTQIFKDLANGVPTAYDDLVGLITDKDGAITRGFEKLPASLQKLVTQLPDKLTGSIAPEILAAAAKSQGIHVNTEDGIKGAAKNMFVPQNLMELVTKPGALVGMLRAIVAALKTRWPAFIGVNVLWSVALMCKLPP